MQNYMLVRDKINSLYQLPRSGWPVDWAGLGVETTNPV